MKKILPLLLAVLFITHAHAQSGANTNQYNLSRSSVAIDGYDPVAYFQQNKAVEGNQTNAAVYEGITYYFSSAANKQTFLKSPSIYQPQYGGWCAYAMGSKGEKVEVDPGTFKIVNNKLYLFYNRFFNNTLKDWNKDDANLTLKADANWQKTIH